MNRKEFEGNVAFVRQAVIEAIPASEECGRQITYDIIIKALAQITLMMINEISESQAEADE